MFDENLSFILDSLEFSANRSALQEIPKGVLQDEGKEERGT